MSGLLLDTNVLSEAMKPSPREHVVDWLRQVDDGYLSVITLHELDFGIALLPASRRRANLETLVRELLDVYADRLLPIAEHEARTAADLRLKARLQGRVLHLADALIGATAVVNDLTLATRNVGDFASLGVRLFDPWSDDPAKGT